MIRTISVCHYNGGVESLKQYFLLLEFIASEPIICSWALSCHYHTVAPMKIFVSYLVCTIWAPDLVIINNICSPELNLDMVITFCPFIMVDSDFLHYEVILVPMSLRVAVSTLTIFIFLYI